MKRIFLVALLMLSVLFCSCGKRAEPVKPTYPVPDIETDIPEEESDIIIKDSVFSEKTDFPVGVSAEIDITAPLAEATLYGENTDNFNQLIELTVDTVKNEYYNDVSIGENAEGAAATSRMMTYEIYTAKDGLISVMLNFDYYVAGAVHPISGYRCINYDLNEGKILTLSDVVGEDKIDAVKNLMLVKMREEPDKYFSTVDGVLDYIDINTSFLEKDGNIYIVIGEYEIAPRSEGIQIFEISKGDIG